MSGSRLPKNPLFNPLNLIERHRAPGRGRGVAAARTLHEPVHSTVPSSKPIHPMNLTEPCWMGQCQTCGRWLISAAWEPLRSHTNVTCYKDPQRCA